MLVSISNQADLCELWEAKRKSYVKNKACLNTFRFNYRSHHLLQNLFDIINCKSSLKGQFKVVPLGGLYVMLVEPCLLHGTGALFN